MQRKEKLKRSSLRYAEYYSMTQVQDSLFQQSKSGKIFTDLIRIIASEKNKMCIRDRARTVQNTATTEYHCILPSGENAG